MSSVSSIDPAAVKGIKGIYKLYQKKDIQMLFIGVTGPIIDVMDRCTLIKSVGINSFYPAVHEAVNYCISISTYQNGYLDDHPQFENNNLSNIVPDFGTRSNT